ncbi:MAG: sensor domain-containing protein, partial [Chloroflexi bacterium]|nr:sensor domain-containing protein [Chloroflexota bacterium]
MDTIQTSIKVQKKSISSVILYILLSFLLAQIYFVLVTVGLSVGLGTVILWIGLPLLIGTFAMIRGIGAIERSLAREMLGVSIAESRPQRSEQGIWRSGLANL